MNNYSIAQEQVVVVSGDRNAAGFEKTMNGFPWVAVPFGEKRPAIETAVPCTGLCVCVCVCLCVCARAETVKMVVWWEE